MCNTHWGIRARVTRATLSESWKTRRLTSLASILLMCSCSIGCTRSFPFRPLLISSQGRCWAWERLLAIPLRSWLFSRSLCMRSCTSMPSEKIIRTLLSRMYPRCSLAVLRQYNFFPVLLPDTPEVGKNWGSRELLWGTRSGSCRW